MLYFYYDSYLMKHTNLKIKILQLLYATVLQQHPLLLYMYVITRILVHIINNS